MHRVDALRWAGVSEDDVHVDTASGARASHPRLDRLGRSVQHLVALGAQGRATVGMLSVLAEFPRELTVADPRDGLAAARARSRRGGRRPRPTPHRDDPARVGRPANRTYDTGTRP